MKNKINWKRVERIIYILSIIGLAIYGLKDTEAAIKLIDSVSKAFSILLNS